MPLNQQQITLCRQALVDAFASHDELEMMLRIQMDEDLGAVAQGDNRTMLAFKLITWAERTGRVRSLVNATIAERPDNPTVRRLADASQSWVLDDEAALAEEAQAAVTSATPASAPAAAVAESRYKYLDHLYTRYRVLDFKGMGMADRVPLQLSIEQMYVPLKARVQMPEGETWARNLLLAGRRVTKEETAVMGERLSEPLPVLDLLQKYAGLVILGDPGAGKTTFVKYLTVMLALGQGEILGLGGRLPVLVPMSAYANSLAQQDVALQDFVIDSFRVRGIDVPVGHVIKEALDSGQALIMLDGLDEVQTLRQRALVVERVETFFDHQRKKGNKFIVTSRVVGYRDVRVSAEGLKECTLVDFDDDDILLFLAKWTQAVEQAAKGESAFTQMEAAEEKAEMLFALASNPGVRQLASNPLLLTILALMKRQGVLLPERRVQLYEQYVQTLLRHWNLARGLDKRAVRDFDVLETTRVLAPLALWMQETSPGAGLVKRGAVQRRLQSIYLERKAADPEQAALQLLSDVRDHASLLLERGSGEYGFIHLTFQEYLAAIAVAQRGQSDLMPVVELLAERLADPRWHEVLLLTIGYMGIVQQRDEAAGEVLQRLIARGSGEPGTAIVLAGKAVLDTWPGGVTQQCRDAIKVALLTTMLDSNGVTPLIRSRAGSILGALGDPRDLDEMVAVPEGTFIMGKERTRHKVNIHAFRIAKYPVTNHQYAQFIAATGHEPPSHWRGKTPPREIYNHPVVNVSWYDAREYCAWLSTVRGEIVRLPTEAEWEKAARGADGREYPWGTAPEPNRANYGGSIGDTSAAGCFPTGASPYGCEDMAGNVWEWTSSIYKPYPYDSMDEPEDSGAGGKRTLRGGAWRDYEGNVRCAVELNLNPDFRYNYVGFRIASLAVDISALLVL
jgi:formylglycine-generating enzyme required for sulfatase activity